MQIFGREIRIKEVVILDRGTLTEKETFSRPRKLRKVVVDLNVIVCSVMKTERRLSIVIGNWGMQRDKGSFF